MGTWKKTYNQIPQAEGQILVEDEVEMTSWTRGEVQPPAYRDSKFAIIFLLHLVLIAVAAFISPSVVRNLAKEIEEASSFDYRNLVEELPDDFDDEFLTFSPDEKFNIQSILGSIVATMFSALGLSLCLTSIALYYFQEHSERIIKASIVFTISIYVGLGLWILLAINPTPIPEAVVLFIIAAFYMGYAYSLWDKIPFAASTLATGATACKANLGVFGFAFVSPILNIGLFVMQTVSLITFFDWIGVFNFIHDSYKDPDYIADYLLSDKIDIFSDSTKFWIWMVVFFYIISLYWTSEVIKNISTVIVSGTIGTWWFTPNDASSFCSNGVMGSFRRATTYSFGSICFGSLVSAIVNAIMGGLQKMKKNRGCVCLYCVIDCLLQWIEYLVEYFNKWAFVYVGLYGYKYTEAGKKVMDLFQARGLSILIFDSLVHRAMFMVATCISVITGSVIGLFWGTFAQAESAGTTDDLGPLYLLSMIDGSLPFELFFAISFLSTFLIALLVTNTFTSVVSTASDTTLVCFAEGAKEFQTNHPQLSIIMREKFAVAYPNLTFQDDGMNGSDSSREVV